MEAALSVRAGRGTCIVVEALPGLGKTSLLRAAADTAAGFGVRVLTARGTPLETGAGFGMVRQLLDPVVNGSGRSRATLFAGSARFAERVFDPAPDGPAPDRYVLLQALHRLTAGLVGERQTLFTVDDVQWADDASLRYLAFLQHRIGELPLGMVLATRPASLHSPPPLLELIASAHHRLRLEPLSAAATQLLLRALVPQVTPRACRAAHELTGGNPLYLRQLSFPGGRLGVPEGLQATVARRVTLIGGEAVAVVRAVHVLGRSARPDLVARLAEHDLDLVRRVVEQLVAAGVLHAGAVLEPVHPLVGDAIGTVLVGGLEPQLRLQAARLLHEEGHDVEEVATLLVGADASAQDWVVDTLRRAAAAATARGAPGAAVPYLRRALLEAPGRQPPEVLLELGGCELLVGDPAALDTLRRALDAAHSDAQVTAAGLALGRALTEAGLCGEALTALRLARSRLAEPEADAGLRLDMEAVTLWRLDFSTLAEVDRVLSRYVPPESDRAVDKLVMAHLSMEQVRRPGTAADAAALARRALADGMLLQDQSPESYVLSYPVLALSVCDELAEAEQALAQMRDVASTRGSTKGLANALCWTSHVALRGGDVAAAEQAARAAIERMQAVGSAVLMPYARAFLSDALVERGELEQAAQLWARAGSDGDVPPSLPASYLLHSRGVLRLASGRPDQAAVDLAESGRREQAAGVQNPALWPWASYLALSLHALGRVQEARDVVHAELLQVRAFGAARPIGISLRTSGLVAPPDQAEPLLREAVQVLRASPARLELAHAQVELGAFVRRHGSHREATELLRLGLDCAARLGAGALVTRARTELAAAGARPRRSAVVGVEALTATERRVAELAARGLTNREIAGRLVVSGKTVETHMHAVLHKLQVETRKELAQKPELLTSWMGGD